MPTSVGPNIIQNGLIVAIDAADNLSYPDTGTAVNNLANNDFSPSLANGTLHNSQKLGSFEFDGSNDYLQISPTGIDVGVNFTVQSWVNVTRFGGAGPWRRGSIIANSYPYSTNQGFWICCTTQDPTQSNTAVDGLETFFISMGNDQYGATAYRGSLTQYKDNWVNLGVVVDGTNLIKLYINGQEVSSYVNQDNGPSSWGYTTGPCSLGVRASNNAEFLDGSISQLLFYSRSLSDLEVEANFNTQKSRFNL